MNEGKIPEQKPDTEKIIKHAKKIKREANKLIKENEGDEKEKAGSKTKTNRAEVLRLARERKAKAELEVENEQLEKYADEEIEAQNDRNQLEKEQKAIDEITASELAATLLIEKTERLEREKAKDVEAERLRLEEEQKEKEAREVETKRLIQEKERLEDYKREYEARCKEITSLEIDTVTPSGEIWSDENEWELAVSNLRSDLKITLERETASLSSIKENFPQANTAILERITDYLEEDIDKLESYYNRVKALRKKRLAERKTPETGSAPKEKKEIKINLPPQPTKPSSEEKTPIIIHLPPRPSPTPKETLPKPATPPATSPLPNVERAKKPGFFKKHWQKLLLGLGLAGGAYYSYDTLKLLGEIDEKRRELDTSRAVKKEKASSESSSLYQVPRDTNLSALAQTARETPASTTASNLTTMFELPPELPSKTAITPPAMPDETPAAPSPATESPRLTTEELMAKIGKEVEKTGGKVREGVKELTHSVKEQLENTSKAFSNLTKVAEAKKVPLTDQERLELIKEKIRNAEAEGKNPSPMLTQSEAALYNKYLMNRRVTLNSPLIIINKKK